MDIFHNKTNLCTKLPNLHICAVNNFGDVSFQAIINRAREENKHEKKQVEPLPIHHRHHLHFHDDGDVVAVRRSANRNILLAERVSVQRFERTEHVF